MVHLFFLFYVVPLFLWLGASCTCYVVIETLPAFCRRNIKHEYSFCTRNIFEVGELLFFFIFLFLSLNRVTVEPGIWTQRNFWSSCQPYNSFYIV